MSSSARPASRTWAASLANLDVEIAPAGHDAFERGCGRIGDGKARQRRPSPERRVRPSGRSATAAPAAPVPSDGSRSSASPARRLDRPRRRSRAASGPASPSSTRTRAPSSAAKPALRAVASEAQRDRLPVCGYADWQHIGPGQRQRPHIGLVGGVGPVALVLHLERVAFHPAFGADAGPDRMRDRPHVLERLPGIDQFRQHGLDDRSIRVLDASPARRQARRSDAGCRSRSGWSRSRHRASPSRRKSVRPRVPGDPRREPQPRCRPGPSQSASNS